MVRKLFAVAGTAILVALPLEAVAAQQYKNFGQCMKACVQDLGVGTNRECTQLCESGTYGQNPAPVGGTLPSGAACSPANDQCAAPGTCQPVMPGWPMYVCK